MGSTPDSTTNTPTRAHYRIWESALLAIVLLGVYYGLRFGSLEAIMAGADKYLPFLRKLSLSLFSILVIVLAGRVVERLIDRSSNSHGVRYNLVRVTRLATTVLILIVVVSFLFQNLYAAALSFGLISLVLGFALQAPITSFIAWLYIVFRHPYHVGDRIQLGDMRGDVMEIGYLDTRVRECGGKYLGNDHASGRIIHFPNSIILKREVINYSGPFQPYIWNETAIQIDWASDLGAVERCLVAAANEDFAAQAGAAEEPVPDSANVYFRDNERAWLEAVIAYPVRPLDTTGRRNRILRKALPRLHAMPQPLPQGNQR